MGGKSTIIETFALADTKKGKITVSHLDEPYGTGSIPVVSIGISLKGDATNPDWKAHIPYENLQQLIESLQKANEQFEASK
ncbi:MAG: hypothetical protein IBX44_02005 [Sulfurospirillum sp.]|nr:hypothetical protein [Sulfurospirillum sp.]